MRVFPCGICFGVMGLCDGFSCPQQLIIMIKRGNKRQCDYLFVCDCVENGKSSGVYMGRFIHIECIL